MSPIVHSAMEVIDVDVLKVGDEGLAHRWIGAAAEPLPVADEADDTAPCHGDDPINLPCARIAHTGRSAGVSGYPHRPQRRDPVGQERTLLVVVGSRVALIGGIADDREDRVMMLRHGGVAQLGLQFRE